MTYLAKSAVLSALIVPAAAFAGLDIGQSLGTTSTEVRTALTGMGYTVHEMETERGKIEAEVTLDGAAYEVYVAKDTGMIVKIELEDDERGEHD